MFQSEINAPQLVAKQYSVILDYKATTCQTLFFLLICTMEELKKLVHQFNKQDHFHWISTIDFFPKKYWKTTNLKAKIKGILFFSVENIDAAS